MEEVERLSRVLPSSSFNRTVRLAVLVYPPYTYACARGGDNNNTLFMAPTKHCLKPGFLLEVLGIVFNIMRVTPVPYWYPETYGFGERQANGSWTGVLADVQQRRVDLTSIAFFPNAEREAAFAASFPVTFVDDPAFLYSTDPVDITDTSTLAIRVFEPVVWLLMLLVVLAVLGLTVVQQQLGSQQRRRKHADDAWIMMRLLFMRNGSVQAVPRGSRSLANVMLVLSTLVVSLYLSRLTGLLQVPLRSNTFTKADQVVDWIATGQAKLAVNIPDSYYTNLLNSPNTHPPGSFLYRLHEAQSSRGYQLIANHSQVFKAVRHENYVVWSDFLPLQHIARTSSEFYSDVACNMDILRVEELFSTVAVLYTHPDFAYRNELSEVLSKYNGMFETIKDKYFFQTDYRADQCSRRFDQIRHSMLGRGLSFMQLASAFVLWALGAVAAAACLLVECLRPVAPRITQQLDLRSVRTRL